MKHFFVLWFDKTIIEHNITIIILWLIIFKLCSIDINDVRNNQWKKLRKSMYRYHLTYLRGSLKAQLDSYRYNTFFFVFHSFSIYPITYWGKIIYEIQWTAQLHVRETKYTSDILLIDLNNIVLLRELPKKLIFNLFSYSHALFQIYYGVEKEYQIIVGYSICKYITDVNSFNCTFVSFEISNISLI